MDSDATPEGPRRGDGRHDPLRRHLGAIYDAYAERMFGYALMLLADAASAEDAVQRVFVKLTRRGALSEIRAAEPYLRRAVRNECYDMLRSRSRRGHTTGDQPFLEALPAPERSVGLESLRAALEQALRVLPAEQREVVCMKVYEQKTFRQIAEAVGIPDNTAASRYRLAVDRLRDLLRPYMRDDR